MADTIKITTLAQLKVALQAAKTYIDGQIGGLGTMAGKSEVAYDDLAAALKTLIDGKAAQATVDTLVGADTGKSVRTISSEEVAKIVAGADKSYDTLKEIADWILSDTTGAAKMANDITRLDGILAGIGGTDEEATVVAYVTKMINALGIGDYVKTTTEQMKILAGKTKSYVDGKVGSASDIQSGDTVKTFSKDYKTVTTVYANGNQLVKTFSDDMKTITSVLTDSEGTVIATETKTLSDDGLTISTDVVYG